MVCPAVKEMNINFTLHYLQYQAEIFWNVGGGIRFSKIDLPGEDIDMEVIRAELQSRSFKLFCPVVKEMNIHYLQYQAEY